MTDTDGHRTRHTHTRARTLRTPLNSVTQVIRNLSKGDVVHFIAYDTQVSVVFENGNPLASDDLIKLVRRRPYVCACVCCV